MVFCLPVGFFGAGDRRMTCSQPSCQTCTDGIGHRTVWAFLLGTLVACSTHTITAVMCDRKAQETFKDQPFDLLLLIFAVTAVASKFVNLSMANSY